MESGYVAQSVHHLRVLDNQICGKVDGTLEIRWASESTIKQKKTDL